MLTNALVVMLCLQEYDATQLILTQGPITQPILIDQGGEDNFLHDKQLLPRRSRPPATRWARR